MKYLNSFCGFDPLEEVWLGDVYPEDFMYDFHPEVKYTWQQIIEMTKEDLSEIEKTLQQRGIVVRRPTFTNDRSDYLDENGVLVKPPITPRDTHLVLGNEFYHLRMDNYKVDPWQKEIDRMLSFGTKIHYGPSHTDLSCLAPPAVTRVGKDLYVDSDSHSHVWPQISPTFVEWAKDFRVHITNTTGHSDGVFCPVREGIIISTYWMSSEYTKTFPGWEIYQLPRENFHQNMFNQWWVPSKEISPNGAFAQHVNEYALHWIGNYQETQFSVNMLVLDDKTVLSVNENLPLQKFLEKRGIEVIVKPFRCKTFWDGGAHCLTVDIRRNGSKRDMFPARPQINYLDWL
jgi:hypothetical protein